MGVKLLPVIHNYYRLSASPCGVLGQGNKLLWHTMCLKGNLNPLPPYKWHLWYFVPLHMVLAKWFWIKHYVMAEYSIGFPNIILLKSLDINMAYGLHTITIPYMMCHILGICDTVHIEYHIRITENKLGLKQIYWIYSDSFINFYLNYFCVFV